jgi:hypothetical protein
MNITRHTVRPLASRRLLLAACALLLLGGAGTASAQLPAGSPTLILSDQFSSGWSGSWWESHWDPYGDDGDWTLQTTPPTGTGITWASPFFLREDDSDCCGGGDGQSILVPQDMRAGGPIPIADRTNIRVEFEFIPHDDYESRIGVMWHGDFVLAGAGYVATDAYLFYIDEVRDDDGDDHLPNNYTLIKRVGGVDNVVASGTFVTADPTWNSTGDTDEDAIHEHRPFRIRLDWYCGYARIQLQSFDCGGGSTCVRSNWITVTDWIDDAVTYGPTLAPGFAGMFSGSQVSVEPRNEFDNFELYSWGDACVPPEEPCGEWTEWSEVNRENLKFKRLYEGALKDYSLGDVDPEFRIDINTTAPTPGDASTFCNGWRLLVDLPEPIITSDLDKVRHYLENTSTAVDFLSDGAGTFQFRDNFDEDPASGTYNPVPMVADGRTPIANSLLDAFDWYVDQREPGGRWEFDPLMECRKWYVVLITDGAESCDAYTRPDGTGGGFACDSGNAADKFANPGVSGVEPIPVFTIGFSETVASAPPQLTCISDITDGQYFGARNASELKDALYGVLNQLNTGERSFSPFKVTPPPSSQGGPAAEQDFLVVYPFFQPIKESSLWAGNLYGFKLNESQPTLPVDSECNVDVSTLVVDDVTGNAWDAAARLTDQLSAATPVRPVFMGQLASGAWSRHDLTEIPTDATLRLYLRNNMFVPGGINDLEAQEVVNFVRNIWVDNDGSVTPDPRDADPSTVDNDARPAGYPVFGDFNHSQPTVVSPPNRSMFFFDYGYGDAHGYASFMEKHAMRRRVVLAGANDGLLHAFDGGIYDRDRSSSTETYNEQHDLGDGSELFAYLPHAVMPRLYNMTYGNSQQYSVDGLIATSDVYIDHDGDSNREWRTVAIATMRRGGRGMVALDITQPDPINATTFVPDVPTDQFPGCLNTGTGCADEYPKVLWEFTDNDDTDGNCPYAPGLACRPFWDLGWTWSKPAIARIAVYTSDTTPPDDVFVAFFGGGWDRAESDQTGNFIYGVDVATGNILYEANLGVAVPGSPAALDSDIDGFHDRIYFADSDGGVHRLQFPSPTEAASTGADAGTLTRIFDFRSSFGSGGFPDRQRFFQRPVMVPALFTGTGYTWALALGSGDRANLDHYDDINEPIDHFFFLLDVGDSTTRGKNDLVGMNFDEVAGDFECTEENSPLDPAGGNYGWYLSLRPNEKVVFEATVINGHVFFPTFDPTPGTTASHQTVDQCVPSGAGTTPTPSPTPNLAFGEDEVICQAAGIGRSYDLWYECGMGEYNEDNDIYTGSEDYTIGGTTYVTFTESGEDGGKKGGDTIESPNFTGHVVTNWRQE